MRVREGVAGSQPVSIAVRITWHGAQINFGNLPPYLTYGLSQAHLFNNGALEAMDGNTGIAHCTVYLKKNTHYTYEGRLYFLVVGMLDVLNALVFVAF
jgi:hypothetical protein